MDSFDFLTTNLTTKEAAMPLPWPEYYAVATRIVNKNVDDEEDFPEILTMNLTTNVQIFFHVYPVKP